MHCLLVVATTCLLMLGSVSGQNDQGNSLSCSGLDVDRDDSPFPGASLSVCSMSADQCCTQEYLDRLTREVREDLLNGLREQITGRMGSLQDILNRISTYLEGDFIEGIRNSIPGSTLIMDNINQVTAGLATILNRANLPITSASSDRFNATQVFVNMTSLLEGELDQSSFLNAQQALCVANRIEQSLNRTSLLILGRSLEALRRSYTAFVRILRFITRFNATLDGFNAESFPKECVERAIEVSFCGRCSARIPPLCRGTCGALVRGCFAGFYSGLEGEFNNLWSVLDQLVRTVDGTVREIIVQQGFFIRLDFFSLAQECMINLGDAIGRRKRQIGNVPRYLPADILSQVKGLSGVFQYGSDGPLFCAVEAVEEQFCPSQTQGEEDRSCARSEVCTSICQCWDGEGMRDTDIQPFTGVSINDQDGNPVVMIPEDVNVAIAKARSTVVTSFLTSQEFEEITPEGLTIPPPSSYDDSGSIVAISMVTVLLTLLVALISM